MTSHELPRPRGCVAATLNVRFALAGLSTLLGWGLGWSALTPLANAETKPDFALTVNAGERGAAFSDTMHGVFFEDINYAADGGLYAEMVQNRSFEHRAPLYAWSVSDDSITLEVAATKGLHKNNPAYARVRVPESAESGAIVNDGFDGFAVQAGERYLAALHVRSDQPGAEVSVVLRDGEGAEIARAVLGEASSDWRRFEGELTAEQSAGDAKLSVEFGGPGAYDLDMVSLFPADTFRGRRNGLRKDLAEKLEGLKPAFVRFPGGCIVEGRTLDNAYRWKDTVGPVWQRKQNDNLWASRENPQYHQTYGLGFFEYFQFCEDIGAEAVPIVNCGMGCQFRGRDVVPMDELGPWVQDALDLVEFANGPIDSKWGKLRADMGHPEPFNLKLLGVGNEQWMEGYFERYLVFYHALKQRYPDLQVVSTSGPQANDDYYHYAWKRFQSDVKADVVDEHYYRSPQWFLSNHERYDGYDRTAPKVFAGEFAAHEPDRASTLRAAVAEAAFMTGLWRNADVVTMASYAPLFAREGAVQWAPDLIWFDNTRSYGTPSYHVQAMYGQNVPDVVLPVTVEAGSAPQPQLRGRIGVGTWETAAEFKDIKVTRGDEVLYESSGDLEEWEQHGGDWTVEDGVLRQTSQATNVRAFVGSEDWTDYTLTLKARKLRGREGFLVSFASTDPRETSWWNLGGWGNVDHGLESPLLGLERKRGGVEEGRWYDVRIEVGPQSVACYLDGEQIHRAELPPLPPVYAAAGADDETGEVIVAIANPAAVAQTGRVALAGGSVTGAVAYELSSDSPRDVNSFEAPTRVAPKQLSIEASDGVVEREFPANSFTILRMQPAK
ncbi:alpha-L-arabinofuranosidase C-terminal domain-containing protein [Botrimarina mediterranea]|uniref:alpha-L-arabinofuranosidase C-terminal domain-containing protein n=1 Tax=Botrimarina mediterranea TaxID=2528022 RepID=UPI00118D064D|nr:Extracellular exo-alpha-L-arabinofuranosidase precursor [Planctomycetes bacterium K2D]